MKISTSLIKIRYAVGVMLALSAIFAVVIGTSTLQPRDAAAQGTVTISVNDTTRTEGATGSDAFTTVTVTLSANATADVNIPLTLGGTATRQVGTTPNDYQVDEETQVTNNDFDGTVRVASGNAEGTVRITINDADDDDANKAEGTETITVALGNLPSGYTEGTTSTVTVAVRDEENSAPTGTTVTISDASPTVADTLTASFADVNALTDADGTTGFDDGPDDNLGTTGDNRTDLLYQWGTIEQIGTPGTPAVSTFCTSPGQPTTGCVGPSTGTTNAASYTVAPGDAGKVLAARVGFVDDTAFTLSTGNYIQSAATAAVLNSVTLSVADTFGTTTDGIVKEGEDTASTATITVTLGAAPGTGKTANIPLNLGGTATRSVSTTTNDYGIDEEGTADNDFDGTVQIVGDATEGTVTITIADDDDGSNAAEGTETITVALGNLPSGYTEGTTSTVTVTVRDEENSAPTGTTVRISDASPAAGDTLTASFADVNALTDADGKTTFEKGPDGSLTTAADNNTPIVYQWGTIEQIGTPAVSTFCTASGTPENCVGPSATSNTASYTVAAADAGKVLAARVGFADDTAFTLSTGNYIQSAATAAVLNSVTLSFASDSADVEETRTEGDTDNTTVTVYVKLSVAPGAGNTANIPLTLGGTATRSQGSTVHDYGIDETGDADNDFDGTVQIVGDATEGTVTITIADDADGENAAEGTETITVSLGTAPAGYANGDDNKVTVTVRDEENSAPTGTTVRISDASPAAGDTLTASFADVNALTDADGKTTFEKGPDGILTTAADNNTPIVYQWGTIEQIGTPAVSTFCTASGTPENCVGPSATSNTASYTVAAADAGKVLAARVGFADDTAFTLSTGNYIQSAATAAVLNSVTLSFASDSADVAEKIRTEGDTDNTTVTVYVRLSASPTADVENIQLTLGGEADDKDYSVSATSLTIPANNDSGSIVITIKDDDDGDDAAEGTETITVSLGATPPTGYANGDDNKVTIKVYDEENSEAVGSPVIKKGTTFANAKDITSNYVIPGDMLIVDATGISDPDGINDDDGATAGFSNDSEGETVTYQWGTIEQVAGVSTFCTAAGSPEGCPTGSGAQSSPSNTRTYTVNGSDAENELAVRVTFTDDANHSPNEMVISAGMAVKRVVNFSSSKYPVKEGESVDVKVTLSNTPATTAGVVVTADGDSALLGGFSVDNAPIALPHTLIFATTDKEKTIRYTAPTDGPGRRTLTLGFGTIPATYEKGAVSSATIVINDSQNSLATGDVTVSDTTPEVGDTLTMTVENLADIDGLSADAAKTYHWYVGGTEADSGMTYYVRIGDLGKKIKASVKFLDDAGNNEEVFSVETAAVGQVSTGGVLGMISEIKPSIRGVTVSAGDTVRLGVDVYGLQGKQDQKLADDVTLAWSVEPKGGKLPAAKAGNSMVSFEAPSSPGTYTVTANVSDKDCRPAKEADRAKACSADFTVKVRRAASTQPEDLAPVNPPGEIPSILADSEGEQYDVFTPVDGGMFDADAGYSITAAAGAVPNGEFIGVRMSDDGAASNAGMTHQRYTLGGNMYGVHVVDSAGAAVSDYVLEDAAKVCVPLPDMFRARISDLALVTINSDSSLTILSANVRLGNGGSASVCGNLSGLPASVAVGSMGAPDAIPTATPVPTPEPPDTGGSAPSSNGMLWALLLGTAILLLGAIVVLTTRRSRKGSEELVS